MTQVPEEYQALAESVSPLVHSLTAGLLIRPVPMRTRADDESPSGEEPGSGAESVTTLCLDLDAMLKEAVPALNAAMTELEGCDTDELDELMDELAAPALDLVDMARRIWEAHLPPEAEGARALLATLAEAPVVQLLEWSLQIMHTVIDPWAITETPESPEISYVLNIPDAPVREALARWRKENPGVLPEEVLR